MCRKIKYKTLLLCCIIISVLLGGCAKYNREFNNMQQNDASGNVQNSDEESSMDSEDAFLDAIGEAIFEADALLEKLENDDNFKEVETDPVEQPNTRSFETKDGFLMVSIAVVEHKTGAINIETDGLWDFVKDSKKTDIFKSVIKESLECMVNKDADEKTEELMDKISNLDSDNFFMKYDLSDKAYVSSQIVEDEGYSVSMKSYGIAKSN